MWNALTEEGIQVAERYIGFLLPRSNRVQIISYIGIHTLTLHPLHLTTDSLFPEGTGVFDSATLMLRYSGETCPIVGLWSGNEIRSSPDGERLELDRESQCFTVSNSSGKTDFLANYVDMSGDWVVLTFSEDYTYILLGTPYDLYLFHRKVTK